VSDSRSVSTSSRQDKRTSPATFYRQVVAELRKVVWPTQEQLITYFLVVLVFVVVVMGIVSLLDLGFGKLAFWAFA
jgi:preprotein translocase subunit SecE